MNLIHQLKHTIVNDRLITVSEAVALIDQPLADLTQAADELRNHFCGNGFDLCTIVNAKSGHCSEDCTYCAQSAHYRVPNVPVYPLMSSSDLLADAKAQAGQGVLRYSLVASGSALSQSEIDQVCQTVRQIRQDVGIEVCVSFGLLTVEQFGQLKAAGVSRIHCNLETSRRFFPQICTSHSYDDKLRTLRAAQQAGLAICSGGIIGLGETMLDRIDWLFDLRTLGVKSIPINLLNPIPGTPLEMQPIVTESELLRTIAIARFIIPDGAIRLAGGRGLLPDKGQACFKSGANAAITGDMLTTQGISVATDKALLSEMGYQVRLLDD